MTWQRLSNMAAITPETYAEICEDNFDVPDDFSDWSDEDFDPTVGEDVSSVFVNDQNEDKYCICDQKPTVSMAVVACADAECAVKWYHPECAGLPMDADGRCVAPEGWICENCRPSASGMADRSSCQQGVVEDTCTSVDTPSKKAKGEKSKTKTAKVWSRPEAKYTKEDAVRNAPSFFQDSLLAMKEHPIFNVDSLAALQSLAIVTHLLTSCLDNTAFAEFCCACMVLIWDSAKVDSTTKLKPEVYEAMWVGFKRASHSLLKQWQDLLRNLSIYTPGEHNVITLNFLLHSVYARFIKARNSTDCPEQACNKTQEPLDTVEEKVLRYVAGYIPFALLKKYQKQINPTAKLYCKFLSSWQVPSVKCAETFLEYTREWINVQNRGGLFNVSDKVYLFVRSMEFIARSFLTKEHLDGLQGVDIKESLFSKIASDFKVQTYWCGLIADKISGDPSKKLMEIIAKCYIKTRTNAFINVYLQIKKAEKNISKKAEKGLRKELNQK